MSRAQSGGSRGKAPQSVGKVESITFLVSVNDTWGRLVFFFKLAKLIFIVIDPYCIVEGFLMFFLLMS